MRHDGTRPRRSRPLHWIVAVALLLGLAWAAENAWRDFAGYRTAEHICSLVAEGGLERALERAREFRGNAVQEQRVAQCLCVGELAAERTGTCAERLESLLERPEHARWLPAPLITAFLVEERRTSGDMEGAASLAARGTREYPESETLVLQELDLRSRSEGEALLLEEFEERLPGLPRSSADGLRRALANRHMKRAQWADAARLLDTEPPEEDVASWRRSRATALGGAGRHEDLKRFLGIPDDPTAAPAEARALYAYVLSVFPLSLEISSMDLLLDALDDEESIEDENLLRFVYTRAVRGAAIARPDLVSELQERAKRRFGADWTIPSEEVARLAAQEAEAPGGEPGVLRFVVEGRREGDRLLLSPSPENPPDSAYEVHDLDGAPGPVVERTAGAHPTRWVLRDAAGAVCGSGSVWPVHAEDQTVPIERGPCRPPSAASPETRRPGDGDRRVFVVILDSADWRIVEYLRARGEMPQVDHLRAVGLHGVLHSHPPYTAAALATITWPSRPGISSFWGLVHKMGAEIGSNNFVGGNPVASLEWMLPDARNLFDVLGSGPHRAANLLRSYGALDLGRHADLTGPEGRKDRLRDLPGPRSLTPAEAAGLRPGAESIPRNDLDLLHEVAGDFDALVALAGHTDLDLVLFRIASFDVLHHRTMFELGVPGRDDGEGVLLSTYRYADRRLAELRSGLDRDDVLIVMSDHGAQGALQHDPSAVFLAEGAVLVPGRLEDRPGLEGLPRLLAELLGVDVDWPSTGLENRVRGSSSSPSGPPPAPPGAD